DLVLMHMVVVELEAALCLRGVERVARPLRVHVVAARAPDPLQAVEPGEARDTELIHTPVAIQVARKGDGVVIELIPGPVGLGVRWKGGGGAVVFVIEEEKAHSQVGDRVLLAVPVETVPELWVAEVPAKRSVTGEKGIEVFIDAGGGELTELLII